MLTSAKMHLPFGCCGDKQLRNAIVAAIEAAPHMDAAPAALDHVDDCAANQGGICGCKPPAQDGTDLVAACDACADYCRDDMKINALVTAGYEAAAALQAAWAREVLHLKWLTEAEDAIKAAQARIAELEDKQVWAEARHDRDMAALALAKGLANKADAERDAQHDRAIIAESTLRVLRAERDRWKNEAMLMAAHQGIDNYQRAMDQRDAAVAALRAADAIRDAAIAAMQRHIVPLRGTTDAKLVSEIYGIFDGPLQREYDKLRAIVGGDRG